MFKVARDSWHFGWAVGGRKLIEFASTKLTVETFRVTNGGGFDGTFSFDNDDLDSTLTAIPEPGTRTLLLAARLARFGSRVDRYSRHITNLPIFSKKSRTLDWECVWKVARTNCGGFGVEAGWQKRRLSKRELTLGSRAG